MNDFFQRVCCRKNFLHVAGTSVQTRALAEYRPSHRLGGSRVPPFAADDIIKQARRYKSKRELTRGIRLIAKADLAIRSNPVSKRLMLEKLVMDLTAEPKPEVGWSQEELPV